MNRLWGLAWALLLFSCSEEGLFQGTADAGSLSLPLPGRSLAPGEPVPLLGSSPDSALTEVAVTLLDEAGVPMNQKRIPIPAQGPWPSYSYTPPPGPASRLLTLRFEAYQGNQLKSRQDWPFFSQPLGFPPVYIQSHPQEIYPESTVVLEAIPGGPWPAETWIRWRLDKKILQQKSVREGGAQLLWEAPGAQGLYNLTAEIYPLAPPPGKPWDLPAPWVVTSRLVVSTLESPEAKDFQPESMFPLLLHFRGNLRDSGFVTPGVPAKASGPLQPRAVNGFFGYALAPGTQISKTGGFLKVSNSGVLEPFSLVLRGMAQGPEAPVQELCRLENPGARSTLILNSLNNSQFKFTLQTPQGSWESLVPGDLSPGAPFLLTLSLIPQKDTLDLLWYYQGLLLKAETLNLDLSRGWSGDTRWSLGAREGFRGIWDEAGIITKDRLGRPSVDPYPWSRAFQEKWAGDLEVIQGFDGLNFPEGSQTTGNPRLSRGSLLLPPGSSLALGGIFPTHPEWQVELPIDPKAPWDGEFRLGYEGESQAWLTWTPRGELRTPSGVSFVPGASGLLTLKIQFRDPILLAKVQDRDFYLGVAVPGKPLIWSWNNPQRSKETWNIPWFLVKKSFNPAK